MENVNNENRDFNKDLDTLIEKENADQNRNYQNQDDFRDDVNHETNDYNRNENNPGEEPIINGEDQIVNNKDSENLNNSFKEDGTLDNEDLENEESEDNELDLGEVSHDPFPSTNTGNF